MKTVSQNTPTIYSATTPENNPPQLVASLVPDEQRISFWPQHFGLIPQWVTLEPRVFGWMDRLCEDYCGGIWNLYTLNNGGAFMAPEPDDDDDETWVLFNAMNGNRAEMSPEAAGTRSQLINSIDILRARRATGLMTRDNYRTVNNITLGKYPEAK
ncbi:TPA: antirestriction protein [Escherichia coli]|nr:antirestriction protein [Escherichia coli]HDQ1412589.1 antirestriction protein [Escherichia coli]